MKKLFTLFLFCCVATTLQAQSIVINKQVKDFPDVSDLSTPLNAGITMYYFMINGTESLLRDASTYMNPLRHEKGTVPNKNVSKKVKERLLNRIIKEVIVYKDSIACMITKIDTSNYVIRWLYFEDNKWLNAGSDQRNSIEEARKLFNTYAHESLMELRRSHEVKKVSTDTLTFVNFVKQYGAEPKEFLLKALANHPLVIYGEIHHRKVSWDLLSSLLTDPRFTETVGTVFLESPYYQQEEFDRFFASKELDREILLDILRSEQADGWADKGEYEFLVNLWKLNQTLTAEKKIRVVPTDEQAPWKLIQTKKDSEKWEENSMDRNTRMADVVENYMNIKADKRNGLFIVGYGHARKTQISGGYSSAERQEPALTAGTQLVQRLSDKNVFIVLQHAPMIRNIGGAKGLVRQGLFDYAFKKNDNKPVAFSLAGSPFGAEPFDADVETCFDNRSGNYADNFDGYIFLQPLKDEEARYVLYEIWSDKFVKEVQRRYALFGWDMKKDFGIKGKLSKEKIIKSLKEEYEGKKRWRKLFE
jgi:hypothetical protein